MSLPFSTPPSLRSKLPPKRKLAVLVCELRDGQNWPLMTIHQNGSGCEIVAGEKCAVKCLQVLNQARDLVMDLADSQTTTLAIVAQEFRAQFEALIDGGFPPALEREDLSNPLPALSPETAGPPETVFRDDVPPVHNGPADPLSTNPLS